MRNTFEPSAGRVNPRQQRHKVRPPADSLQLQLIGQSGCQPAQAGFVPSRLYGVPRLEVAGTGGGKVNGLWKSPVLRDMAFSESRYSMAGPHPNPLLAARSKGAGQEPAGCFAKGARGRP